MKKIAIMLLSICIMLSSTTQAQRTLNSAIQSIVKMEAMESGALGICVMEARSGEILAQYNTSMVLIPASIMKTVTTASSLAILGANYQFKTKLEYDGTITSNGTLKGNLYLTGTGDPMLGSNEVKKNEVPKVKKLTVLMDGFVAALKAKGIQKIEGAIIGDATHFESELPPATWQWNDLGNYYGTGASALNIHENLYYLYFGRSATVGEKTTITKVAPKMPFLTFTNEVTLEERGSGDNAYIYGAPRTYHRYIRGTIPVGTSNFRIKGSIPDPAYFAAYTLMNALEKNNIRTQKIATTQHTLQLEGKAVSKTRKTLTTYRSPKISAIIQRANEKSINLYCESLLKAIGKKQLGKGDTKTGIEAVKTYWAAKGFDDKGFFMEDGSGLSRHNGVTAFQMADFLRLVAKNKTIFQSFYNSLPVGGKTGTMRYLFKNKTFGSKIRAKSGSMNRVRAYTGYAKTRSGKLVTFALIANNFTGKSRFIRDKMAEVMLGIAQLP